jgi:hypothetical protein
MNCRPLGHAHTRANHRTSSPLCLPLSAAASRVRPVSGCFLNNKGEKRSRKKKIQQIVWGPFFFVFRCVTSTVRFHKRHTRVRTITHLQRSSLLHPAHYPNSDHAPPTSLLPGIAVGGVLAGIPLGGSWRVPHRPTCAGLAPRSSSTRIDPSSGAGPLCEGFYSLSPHSRALMEVSRTERT